MKLSKVLMQAILVGITIGAVSACTKSTDLEDADAKKCIEKSKNNNTQPNDCPGCGMG